MELDSEQKALRTVARDFLQRECPKALLRELAKDPSGFPSTLYSQMAKLGWFALIIPEEYDGIGSNFVDVVVLLEEMGGACLPGPFLDTAVLGALALVSAGTGAQKQAYLPGIAAGSTLVGMAPWDLTGLRGASGVVEGTTGDEGALVLNGTTRSVSWASAVDYLIVASRTVDSPECEGCVSLFFIDAKAAGITVARRTSSSEGWHYDVALDKVRVAEGQRLGELGQGRPIVERLLPYAAVGLSAQIVGGAQRILEMTIDYAKARTQFGHPIGSFQAIQFHCADMAIDVDASRYITYRAAWALAHDEPQSAMFASAAKAWTGDAYLRIAETAHRVHGAVAFSDEYDLQFYLKAAFAARSIFGDTAFHRERVAQMVNQYQGQSGACPV